MKKFTNTCKNFLGHSKKSCFIQYLIVKAEQQEKQEWGLLSLSSAVRDMEDESALYSMEDIKVLFV